MLQGGERRGGSSRGRCGLVVKWLGCIGTSICSQVWGEARARVDTGFDHVEHGVSSWSDEGEAGAYNPL